MRTVCNKQSILTDLFSPKCFQSVTIITYPLYFTLFLTQAAFTVLLAVFYRIAV